MIWRWSFPRGREVNFGNESLLKEYLPQFSKHILQFEDASPLPLALHINQESRQEALKYYTILFRGDSEIVAGQKTLIERPFCYNPKLDIAYINPIALQSRLWHVPQGDVGGADPWLPYLASTAPSVLTNTQTLEIRGWFKSWPSPFYLRWFRDGSVGMVLISALSQTTTQQRRQYMLKQLEPLPKFRGLKEIKLVWHGVEALASEFAFTQALHLPNTRWYLDGIKEFLEAKKGGFGGEAPLLTVIGYEE
ncbi:hypothetical protein V8E51_015869 [Hyaloscypha variabilis]